MRIHVALAVSAALAAAAAPVLAASVQYKAIDLGLGQATAINSSGTVAGADNNGLGDNRIFRWNSSTGFTYLTTPTGYHHTAAGGINGLGQIAGTAFDGIGGWKAILWNTDGSLNFLQTPQGASSSASAINDSGLVVGLVTDPATGTWHSAVWLPDGTLKYLADWSTETYGACVAVNNSGQIAGFSSTATNHFSVVWETDGTVRRLTTSGTRSEVHGLNENGRASGYAMFSNTDYAVSWDADGKLKSLTPGSVGYGINNLGWVSGRIPGTTTGAFSPAAVWDPTGVLTKLPMYGDHNYAHALAINDAGYVVGFSNVWSSTTGLHSDEHAILWVPVPEPSSVLALASGVMGVAALARYQRKR